MKNIRLVALGVALATGSIAAVTMAGPAQARENKDEKQDEAKKPTPSKEFIKLGEPAHKAVTEKKFAEAVPLIEAAKAKVTTPDDKYYLGWLQVNVGANLNNEPMMEEGMKNVVDSGFASKQEASRYYGNLGILASQRKEMPVAVDYYEKAIAAGNTTVVGNLAEAYFADKQYVKAINTINNGISAKKAAGEEVPEGWYKRVNAFAIGSGDSALIANAFASWLSAYPTPENWRAVLVGFRDEGNLNSSGLIDLYRLMRQTGSLKGERDYVEYSEELYKNGLYAEASSVIEEGFQKGDVPAGSQAGKDLRGLINPRLGGDKASLTNEAKAIGSLGASPTSKIANAYLAHGDYAEAERLYGIASTKPGADMDDINTKLGIIKVMSGDKAAAKEFFAKVQAQPRAGIAGFWLLWLNTNSQ